MRGGPSALLVAALVIGVPRGPGAARAAEVAAHLDLAGTWHVLVHYRDKETAHPEAWHWEDRVWVFAHEGNRLRWTEYPIVVFQDESGRFEWLGTNRQSRVVHAWEPNPGQVAQIGAGLAVNSRGSKTKLLQGSAEEGWRSGAAPRPASASVITYSETWSVEGLPDRPVFAREDFLSSARAMGMEGRTEYRTEAVLDDGELLRGRYQRDDSRAGTFRMLRAGPVATVKGRGKTPQVRAVEMFWRQAGPRLGEQESLRHLVSRATAETELPEQTRREVRQEIRALLEANVRAQGEDPARLRGQIESLTRQIERILLDEGKSLDDVQGMLEAGRLAP